MPSDVMGFSMFNPGTREFEYREGVAMCNFLLADEINRASAKTQSSLLEIMEEAQVTIDGKTYALPQPFMVLATQNPIESYGTYLLPEAQMDRFFLKLSIGYPCKSEEKMILDRFERNTPLLDLNPAATMENIIEMQRQVKMVKIADILKTYIIDLVDETRKNTNVSLGVSPRGSLSLMKAAKAWAYIKGRDYVIPDDIQAMAVSVLSHRIIRGSSSKIKNLTEEAIILETLNKVEVPI
jgi:MoxR-like ATPase